MKAEHKQYGCYRAGPDPEYNTRREAMLREKFPGCTVLSVPEAEELLNNLPGAVQAGDRFVFLSVYELGADAQSAAEQYLPLFRNGLTLCFADAPFMDSEIFRAIEAMGRHTSGEPSAPGGDIVCGILNLLEQYGQELIRRQLAVLYKELPAEEKTSVPGAAGQAAAEAVPAKGQYTGRADEKPGPAEKAEHPPKAAKHPQAEKKQMGKKKPHQSAQQKREKAKKEIREHCKEFGGTLTDSRVIKLCGVSANTFYKYKAEVRQELQGPFQPANPEQISFFDGEYTVDDLTIT